MPMILPDQYIEKIGTQIGTEARKRTALLGTARHWERFSKPEAISFTIWEEHRNVSYYEIKNVMNIYNDRNFSSIYCYMT